MYPSLMNARRADGDDFAGENLSDLAAAHYTRSRARQEKIADPR
jgi:hypothetical protein